MIARLNKVLWVSVLCCMTLFPCKLAYSALLGLDSTFPKLDKNVAKKISHATQQVSVLYDR